METQDLLLLLFGVLAIVILFVDIHLYWQSRKMSNKLDKMVQELKELANIIDKLRKRI